MLLDAGETPKSVEEIAGSQREVPPPKSLGRSQRVSPAESQAHQSLVGGALEPIAEELEEAHSNTPDMQMDPSNASLSHTSAEDDVKQVDSGNETSSSSTSDSSGDSESQSSKEEVYGAPASVIPQNQASDEQPTNKRTTRSTASEPKQAALPAEAGMSRQHEDSTEGTEQEEDRVAELADKGKSEPQSEG